MRPRIILIGGGSASGKTFLANKIKERLKDEVSIVNLDNFYKNNTQLTFEERTKVNYDHPDSIDDALIVETFKKLTEGKNVDIPIYDFATHLRSDKTARVNINTYIIVDGIFALYYKDLVKLADLKIYMDADEDVRLSRRIKRDTEERGRTRDSVLKQFKETVAPMHKKFIEKTKKNADVIIENNENSDLNKTAVTRIIKRIEDIIK